MTDTTSFQYGQTGKSTTTNELGMRPMQERAWEQRGAQFLLIKSPPASGKSRAVMYIVLDKLRKQGLKKAIVTVPESVIGASFANEALKESGFTDDWAIDLEWDLCDTESLDDGKVNTFGQFLDGKPDGSGLTGRILLCAHATFRLAMQKYGVERFDDCVIALDEVHHASSDTGANVLGSRVSGLIDRGKAHVLAMTGTFFRGDAVPVFSTEDEAKFTNVTYTCYEQLDGYKYLKSLVIDHTFFDGEYAESIMDVVDTERKTIIYIPPVQSRDTTHKTQDVDLVISRIGKEQGRDKETGFRLVKCAKTGRVLRVADLVDDNPDRRIRVVNALRDKSQKHNRDFVDIIIALNMAKEGFDWIWAEHAVAIGYRASLTEVVQMMGRVTRDAKGKTRARFTNMIRDPDADSTELAEAVNDRMKAIFMGLLMEQVYAPSFKVTPVDSGPLEGYEYEGGYQKGKQNKGVHQDTKMTHIQVKDLPPIKDPRVRNKLEAEIADIARKIAQHPKTAESTLIIPVASSEENDADDMNAGRGTGADAYAGSGAEIVTQEVTAEVLEATFPELTSDERKDLEPHVQTHQALIEMERDNTRMSNEGRSGEVEGRGAVVVGHTATAGTPGEKPGSNKIITDRSRLILDVTELNIDLIARFHPYATARRILGKDVDSANLRQVKDSIERRGEDKLTDREVDELAARVSPWQRKHGRWPQIGSSDRWERRLAYVMHAIQKRGS